MSEFLQFTVSATTLACTIALIATGWVLIYQVSGILNLAQGSFLVFGGLAFVTIKVDWGLGVVVAVLGACAFVATLGVAADFLILKPARQTDGLPAIFITLGLAYVLGELANWIWGPDPRTSPHYFTDRALEVGGVSLQIQVILLWAATISVFLVLWLVFSRTIAGKAMRACAQSPRGAALVGINPARVRSAAFGIAAGLGALAGTLLIPLSAMSWSDGIHVGLQGFVAAVLGRWSYSGAIAGAALLAAVETYTAGYISSAWKDAMWLFLLIVVLLAAATRSTIRPSRQRKLRRARVAA